MIELTPWGWLMLVVGISLVLVGSFGAVREFIRAWRNPYDPDDWGD